MHRTITLLVLINFYNSNFRRLCMYLGKMQNAPHAPPPLRNKLLLASSAVAALEKFTCVLLWKTNRERKKKTLRNLARLRDKKTTDFWCVEIRNWRSQRAKKNDPKLRCYCWKNIKMSNMQSSGVLVKKWVGMLEVIAWGQCSQLSTNPIIWKIKFRRLLQLLISR